MGYELNAAIFGERAIIIIFPLQALSWIFLSRCPAKQKPAAEEHVMRVKSQRSIPGIPLFQELKATPALGSGSHGHRGCCGTAPVFQAEPRHTSQRALEELMVFFSGVNASSALSCAVLSSLVCLLVSLIPVSFQFVGYQNGNYI